jgi:hypothetical protein
MATRWTWVPLPRHPAKVDETMKVLWSDYYGAALFGDEEELACLPYKGCRLEVVATAESAHHVVNRILPGQVIRYAGTFCCLDRFDLSSGTTVGLWHLIGFKLRLAPDTITPVPDEDAMLDRARGKGGAPR